VSVKHKTDQKNVSETPCQDIQQNPGGLSKLAKF